MALRLHHTIVFCSLLYWRLKMAYICLKFTYVIPTNPQKSLDTIHVRFSDTFGCLEKFHTLEEVDQERKYFRERRLRNKPSKISWLSRWLYNTLETLLSFEMRSQERKYLFTVKEALHKAQQEGTLEEWSTRENCSGEYLLVTEERGQDIYRYFQRRNPHRDYVSLSPPIIRVVSA
jgi:hypothetical protein